MFLAWWRLYIDSDKERNAQNTFAAFAFIFAVLYSVFSVTLFFCRQHMLAPTDQGQSQQGGDDDDDDDDAVHIGKGGFAPLP